LFCKKIDLLYLHRSFFARAISDHPKDPLGSPYGTSVIAAYRSAGSLVAMMRNLYTQLKEPSERMWFLWTHMFSCAIVLGSIVTRCPSMSLAPSALVQLDSACDLFSKAARGFRAVKVLNIMLHLQEKAHFSLDEFRRGKGSPLSRYSSTNISTSPDNDDDELSMLGGKTRLVSKKEPGSPTIIDRSPTSQNPIVPLPLSPTMQNQVHPSVLEYLQSFDNSGHSQQLQQTQMSPNTNGFSNNIASSTSHDSYADVDISPVSIYGMSTLPAQSFQEASTYLPRHTLQDMMQPTQQSMTSHQAPQIPTRNDTTFPQYFPVYDYGGSSSSSYTNGNGSSFGQGPPPILDANPAPGQRRSSGSPDVNMQSTWQDFVNNLAMQ